MKKNHRKWIVVMLVVALMFVFAGCGKVTNEAVEENKIIKVNRDYNETELSTLFDFYDYEKRASFGRITAFKIEDASTVEGKINVSIGDTEKIRTAYDVQYNYDAEIIYLTISTFDEEDNILSVLVAEAFPIYYEDGSFDALFDIDGKKVFLSEIQSGEAEDCFFFSLTASLLVAKITATLIIAAKVTAVVVGVVVVGAITYSVASLTKAKIEERIRAANKEINKKNPRYYYPATRKKGKLLIAASPLGLLQASKNITTGLDFWTPAEYMAKELAVTASGGFIGPEIDSKKIGYYYHYHLVARKGGHSFYGTPYGGKY